MQAIREQDYYAALQAFYRPVRILAWVIVALVVASGFFARLNTMYGAVAGRTRELATLQTLGFRRQAILLSLLQEATLLSATGSRIAGVLARTLFDGWSVRFTMGAFALNMDGMVVLVGCSVGLILGLVGVIPAALRAMHLPVGESLKAA